MTTTDPALKKLVADADEAEGSIPLTPAHREIAKAMAPGPLAVRAVMKMEREVIALRRELRGE